MAPADDPYAVLGIRRTASDKEIAKAYRALALKYHPDRNPGSSSAEAHFKRVSAAYETLKDATKRAQFESCGVDWPNMAPPPFRTYRETRVPFTYHIDLSDLFRPLFGRVDPPAGCTPTGHDDLRALFADLVSGGGRPNDASDAARPPMVRVHGLARDTTHNGAVGQVVAHDPHTHHVVVRMASSGSTLACQPSNVVPLVSAVVCGVRSRPELNGRRAYLAERTPAGRYVAYVPPALHAPITVRLRRLRLDVDTPVRLRGLEHVEYNGLHGCVVDVAPDGSRYTVATPTCTLRVRPKHIRVVLD